MLVSGQRCCFPVCGHVEYVFPLRRKQLHWLFKHFVHPCWFSNLAHHKFCKYMQIRQFSDLISLRWTQIRSHGWFSHNLSPMKTSCVGHFLPCMKCNKLKQWESVCRRQLNSWRVFPTPSLSTCPTARHELHKRPSHWFWVLDILHSGLVTGQGKAGWGT